MLRPDEGGDGGAGGGAAAPTPSVTSTSVSTPSTPSTPSATPATVTTHSSTPSLRDSELPPTNLFEALGMMDDASPEPTPSPPSEPATPPQIDPPQEPKVPPQAQPAQPAAPPSAEPTQTQEPTAQPPAAAVAPQASVPYSRETIEQLELPENREALINGLFEQFDLTPEDLNGLATDAAPVLRRIAARVLYATTLHTLKTLREFSEQHLPSRFAEMQDASRRAETHLTRFQRMWPSLSDSKYGPAIDAAAAQVKKMPGITQEGLYRTVGRMVAAQFGLNVTPIDVQAAPNNSGNVTSVQRQAAPFAPAATGGGPSAPSSQPNGTSEPFAGLGMDFD